VAVEKFEPGHLYRSVFTGTSIFILEVQCHDYGNDKTHSACLFLHPDGKVANWALRKAAFEELT
jgi:hypothetical protein